MKKLLVVVDYQNDFVIGSLGFPKAVELENKIYNKIMEYKLNYQDVLFTLDTHYDQKYETSHKDNNSGWDLYGKVKDLNTEDTLKISKHSCISLDLCEYLIHNQYDSIEFVGIVTNMCVIGNAVIARAALPESEIIIDAACVASNNESLHEKALDVMESLQFKIVNRGKD